MTSMENLTGVRYTFSEIRDKFIEITVKKNLMLLTMELRRT